MIAITSTATKIIQARPNSDEGQLDLVIEGIEVAYPNSHNALAMAIHMEEV